MFIKVLFSTRYAIVYLVQSLLGVVVIIPHFSLLESTSFRVQLLFKMSIFLTLLGWVEGQRFGVFHVFLSFSVSLPFDITLILCLGQTPLHCPLIDILHLKKQKLHSAIIFATSFFCFWEDNFMIKILDMAVTCSTQNRSHHFRPLGYWCDCAHLLYYIIIQFIFQNHMFLQFFQVAETVFNIVSNSLEIVITYRAFIGSFAREPII